MQYNAHIISIYYKHTIIIIIIRNILSCIRYSHVQYKCNYWETSITLLKQHTNVKIILRVNKTVIIRIDTYQPPVSGNKHSIQHGFIEKTIAHPFTYYDVHLVNAIR